MNSVNTKSKQFPAVLDQLPNMLEFICENAQYAGFQNSALLKIELAAEEAIVNIISHGYEPSHHEPILSIACSHKSGEFKITLSDYGKSFNPLEGVRRLNTRGPIAGGTSYEVGGYGIYFIVNMMDRVDYNRVNDVNVLTLTKYL